MNVCYTLTVNDISKVVEVKKAFKRAVIVKRGDSLIIKVSTRVSHDKITDDLVQLEKMGIIGEIRERT